VTSNLGFPGQAGVRFRQRRERLSLTRQVAEEKLRIYAQAHIAAAKQDAIRGYAEDAMAGMAHTFEIGRGIARGGPDAMVDMAQAIIGDAFMQVRRIQGRLARDLESGLYQ